MPRAPSASAWLTLARLKTIMMHMQRPSIDLSLTRHIGRLYWRQVVRLPDDSGPGTVMIAHLRFFVRLYCRAIIFTLGELRRTFGPSLPNELLRQLSFCRNLGYRGWIPAALTTPAAFSLSLTTKC